MPIPEVHERKPALVLSGGGAYGAYEVGVIKALADASSPAAGGAPLAPTLISGTSVGGFNASVLAARAAGGLGAAVRHLEKIWMEDVADAPGRGNGVYRIRGNPMRLLDLRAIREPLSTMGSLA